MPRPRCIAASACRRVACSTRIAPATGHPPVSRRSPSSSCSAIPLGRRRGACAASLGVDGALELGLIGPVAGSTRRCERRALLDLRPYAFTDARGAGEWWILSDLGELALGHALGEQHVLGVGGASMTLWADAADPARRVLDLGTGCGIQAMHASRFADEVVATDISRARSTSPG